VKWTKAKTQHICTYCIATIKEEELYFSGPYKAFCKKCGKKFIKGELHYSKKDNSYIDVKDNRVCSYCKEAPIGVIKGKSVCQEHIGKVIKID